MDASESLSCENNNSSLFSAVPDSSNTLTLHIYIVPGYADIVMQLCFQILWLCM